MNKGDQTQFIHRVCTNFIFLIKVIQIRQELEGWQHIDSNY